MENTENTTEDSIAHKIELNKRRAAERTAREKNSRERQNQLTPNSPYKIKKRCFEEGQRMNKQH